MIQKLSKTKLIITQTELKNKTVITVSNEEMNETFLKPIKTNTMQKLSKLQIESLNELIGTEIYHASPGIPMHDRIESFDIESDHIYFNFLGKDYGQHLPLNKVNRFLKSKVVVFDYEMHAVGFKIATNCCSIVNPND